MKEYIDDLKIEMGWTFLDNGEYKEGLGVIQIALMEKHGEVKCNGMARALTEMGYHDEARRVLKLGLKKVSRVVCALGGYGGLA